jgi:hypothetical protein
MEKHIMKYSYWLGIVSVLMAFLTRVLNMFGVSIASITTKGGSISYRSFLDGSLLFFLAAIATANYLWFKSQKY